MNKRKPYYIIIAALCFATIISFSPYLSSWQNDVEGDGYKIDTAMAALNNIIKKVARIRHSKNIVYNTAKNIINVDRQTIESRLKENSITLLIF